MHALVRLHYILQKTTTTTHTCDSRVESQIGSVYGGSKPVSDGTMVPASS